MLTSETLVAGRASIEMPRSNAQLVAGLRERLRQWMESRAGAEAQIESASADAQTEDDDAAIPGPLLSRLMQKKLMPFLGAGCSTAEPSRLPTASGLAEELVAKGAGETGDALEDIAEKAFERGDWQEFAQILPIEEWRVRPANTIVRVIAELCKEELILRILNTNWDILIERALKEIGQPYALVVDATTMATQPADATQVIKVNGCIEHPEFIKATREQVESADWLDAWVAALFDVLIRTNSLLFAGYSGASRAATTAITRIIGAGERGSRDFLVDRATPAEIGRSSESGRRFIEVVELGGVFTGEATEFFEALRAAVFPLLLNAPATRAKEMAEEVVRPTNIPDDELEALILELAQAFQTAGPLESQRWLQSCFGSFEDCEHSNPYLPVIPNGTEIGKCLLFLAVAKWSDRLRVEGYPLGFSVGIGQSPADFAYRLVVCPPGKRRDVVAREAVARFASEARDQPGQLVVGVSFGGLGDLEETMTTFNVARGSQVADAARGGGASVGWVNADDFFGGFAPAGDRDGVRQVLAARLDAAAEASREAAA